MCTCPPGFTDRQCQTNVDNCASSPCINGTCSDERGDDYTCSCERGFTGRNCDININDCASETCQSNGTCVDGIDSFVCECPPMIAGRFCEASSNCDPADNVCQNNGLCVVGEAGSVNCSCAGGFTGEFCETEIDECLSQPCENGGTCLSIPVN